MNLTGKKIWLIGASSGIGLALHQELLKRGAAVAVTSRSLSAGHHAYPGDVTDLAAMKEMAKVIEKDLGGIDIVISNAGIHAETWPERSFDTAEYRSIMETNFFGMLNAFDAALPSMIERGAGTLVGVASLAGYRGLPRSAAYGASKASMIHFMESVRFHLRRKGISVVVVNPGFVKTPMTAKNDFHMPFLVSPEEAAVYICNGLEREKNMIAFPGIFAAFLAFTRVVPFFIYDYVVEKIWRSMKYS